MSAILLTELPDDILGIIVDLLDPLSYECFRRTSSQTRRFVAQVYENKRDSVAAIIAETRTSLVVADKHSTNPMPLLQLIADFGQHCKLSKYMNRFGILTNKEVFNKYMTICDAYTKEMCKYYSTDKWHTELNPDSAIYGFKRHIARVIRAILIYESDPLSQVSSAELRPYYDKYMIIMIRLYGMFTLGMEIVTQSLVISNKKCEALFNRYYYPEYYLPVFMYVNVFATIKRFSNTNDLRQYKSYIHPKIYETHDTLESLYRVVQNQELNIDDFLESDNDTDPDIDTDTDIDADVNLDANANLDKVDNDSNTTFDDDGFYDKKKHKKALARIQHHIYNYLPATRLPYH